MEFVVGMIFFLRNIARRATAAIHRRLFGHAMSSYMRHFLRQLSFSFVGLTAANGILFGTLLLVGRLLGPDQFGLFALVVAISQIIIIPMMLGMDVATMRSVAIYTGRLAMKRRIVSSGFLVMQAAAILITLVVFGMTGWLSARFDIDRMVLRAATVLALAVVFKNFFDGVIRGEGRFKFQARARIFEALVVLVSFGVLFWAVPNSGYTVFVMAMIVGAGMISLLYLTVGKVARLLARQYWEKEEALRLWRYIRFGMVGALGGLLLVSGDKLLIERLLGQASLGVYAAYYFISVQVAAQISYVFINVFFPMVSRRADKLVVLKKLDRLIGVFFMPATLAVVGGMAVSLWLLSDAYPFSWLLIFSMSVYAMLFFIFQTYWWFIASTGSAGVKFTSLNGLVAGVVYLVCIRLLVLKLTIFAPAISFGVAFAYLGCVIRWWKVRFAAGALTDHRGDRTI